MMYRRIKNSDFIIREEPDDIDVYKVIANVFPYGTTQCIVDWYSSLNSNPKIKDFVNIIWGTSSSNFFDWITNISSKRKNLSISEYLFSIIDVYGIEYQLVKGNGDPLVRGYTVTVDGFNNIANYIITKYYDKWYRLYDTINITQEDVLNPLNIEHTETETNQLDSTNNTETNRNENYESNDSNTTNGTSTDKTQGYNSTGFSDVGQNISENTDTGTSEETGTISQSVDNTYNRSEDKDRNYTKKGNIGNISKTKLLTEYRDYLNLIVLDTIEKDITNELCGKYFVPLDECLYIKNNKFWRF